MRSMLAALVSGFVFALGLALSGMTQPSKIVGFLDVFGSWDPTLAFVMIGAVGVHFGTRLLVMKREQPLFQPRFVLPTNSTIDKPLIVGAVLFGAGWGLAGYCPGPAVVSLGSFAPAAVLFVVSMGAGMLLFSLYQRRLDRRLVPAKTPEAPAPPSGKLRST